jgi:hypothetical protein
MRLFHFLAPAVAALGIAFGLTATTARAADETPKTGGGTITGTVVDKDGKAVEGAKVRVTKPREGGRGQGRGEARPQQAQDPKPGEGAGPGGRRPQQPAVAEGTTDKDGKFTIKNVPAGDYGIGTMIQGKGFGRARVTVKEGETAEVKLTLQEGRPGGGAGRRPGGNAQ